MISSVLLISTSGFSLYNLDCWCTIKRLGLTHYFAFFQGMVLQVCGIHIPLELFPFTLTFCNSELRQHPVEEGGLGAACVITSAWDERLERFCCLASNSLTEVRGVLQVQQLSLCTLKKSRPSPR